ncbi:MAG: hypothetical protein Q4B54_12630, partial [Coriobacteriales bacterium]|nr:hypothetical protein [Coriobacteriales bacterium]
AESAQEQPSAPEPQVYSGDVADFEARRAQIEADIDSDPRTGGSMYEMRAAAIDYTTNLESLMNDLYAYALELPGVDTGALEAAQDEWAASWQARLDALKDEFAGSHSSGYAASVRSHSEYAEYLNRRIDELLDLVYATTGAERGASPAEISAQQEEPTEEPTYTVRYRVGDESFAGDYAYIPESPNACRAAYGDDCLTLHGYHWSFDVPGTGISATYLEGEEDRGAIGVGGPLYQLVDGIGPDESVPLVELVSHLVSSEGTFDLTQVDVQGKASAFGNSYIYHSGYGSKDFTNYTGSVVILFAESPVDPQASFYSQGRVLQVSSENGYVSGSSQAGLSPWLQ